ncbi:MAG TPA: hypothetical protein VHE37_12755, partial [Nevskiaceae bacterium]|nr:hypothetical protein [Nevskiaceae bacterium]
MSDPLELEWRWSDPRVLGETARQEIEARVALAQQRLREVHYPEVPSAGECHLSDAVPAEVPTNPRASAGIASPLLEEARQLSLYPDYKYLSDLRRRARNEAEYARWQERFERM